MNSIKKLNELLKNKYQKQVQFEEIDLVSPEQLGIDQDSPFHLACFRGDLDDVNLMISVGTDVNHKGDIGDTPLHYATRMQRESVIKALIIAGASLEVENDYGDTPLDIAEIEGNRNIIDLLRNLTRPHDG